MVKHPKSGCFAFYPPKSNPNTNICTIIESKHNNDMKYLTPELIKQHSRIDSDEQILELYGSSAEETLLTYIGRTYEELMAEYTKVPDRIIHATLMLVDVSYQYRNPMSIHSMFIVPYTFDMLVKPFVKL